MPNRLQVHQLLFGRAISPASQVFTSALDLRNQARVECLVSRGHITSPGTNPHYKLNYVQGIRSIVAGDDPFDAFEPFSSGTNLLVESTSVDWLVTPVAAILTPFVEFVIATQSDTDVGCSYDLFAYVRYTFG